MNDRDTSASAPNVEEIIASIRAARKSISSQVNPSQFVAATAEDNLATHLKAANEHYLLTPPRKGIRALCNLLLFKLLGHTIRQINEFHADVVRVLNKLTRLLEGEDPAVSALVEIHRRRITLTEMMAERLAQYDALHIDERLKALEDAIGSNRSSKQDAS